MLHSVAPSLLVVNKTTAQPTKGEHHVGDHARKKSTSPSTPLHAAPAAAAIKANAFATSTSRIGTERLEHGAAGRSIRIPARQSAIASITNSIDWRPADWQPSPSSIFQAPPIRNVSILAKLALHYLNKEDLAAFKRATGTSVIQLIDRIATEVAQGGQLKTAGGWEKSTDLLTSIVSNDKIIFHPLNQYGLHPFRSLMSERILEFNRKVKHASQIDLFDHLEADGIVVIPLVDKLLNSSVENLYAARGGYVARLMEAVSGYALACCGIGGGTSGRGASLRSPHGPTFSKVRPFSFHGHDKQIYMHTDTYQPTWKVWAFMDVTKAKGPFHYIYGSHRNTEGKLRWLFDRTYNRTDVPRKPAASINHGPYHDDTHMWQDSIRFNAFDPAVPVETTSAADLQRYGFKQPTPILAPKGGVTLVIADTSGLHYRGVPARSEHVRLASRLNSLGGGCGYCIPRKNPFWCGLNPQAC